MRTMTSGKKMSLYSEYTESLNISTSLCPSRNEKFCSRARRYEVKKRRVIDLHEHFSPKSNATIVQKGLFWLGTSLRMTRITGCSRHVLDILVVNVQVAEGHNCFLSRCVIGLNRC